MTVNNTVHIFDSGNTYQNILLCSKQGRHMDQSIYQAILSVKDLEKVGINSEMVILAYENKKGIKLNLNELIKVSSYDEGQTINFETLDQISINVRAADSDGNPNKVEPPEKF